jgi:hypothetical protein
VQLFLDFAVTSIRRAFRYPIAAAKLSHPSTEAGTMLPVIYCCLYGFPVHPAEAAVCQLFRGNAMTTSIRRAFAVIAG